MFVPAFLQSQLYDVFVGDCGEADLNLKGPSAAQTPAFPQAATETHHSFPWHHLTMFHPLSSWHFFFSWYDRQAHSTQ